MRLSDHQPRDTRPTENGYIRRWRKVEGTKEVIQTIELPISDIPEFMMSFIFKKLPELELGTRDITELLGAIERK